MKKKGPTSPAVAMTASGDGVVQERKKEEGGRGK